MQRCWAHKIRNVLNKVRKPDQAAIKADLHRIMNAPTLPAAWSAARRFADRWQDLYPKAVACLRADLDDLLTCLRYPTLEERKARPHHQCDRAPLPRGPPPHPPHGHLPGQNLHGPHPVRRLHPRKPQPGPRHPLRPDTQLLTLPDCLEARPQAVLTALSARATEGARGRQLWERADEARNFRPGRGGGTRRPAARAPCA